MSTAYSQSKPLWHLDRLAVLRRGVVPVPVHVQFVLSDLCNQDCHFCAYRISDGLSTELFADANGNKNPNRRMDTNRALELVRDMAVLGVKAIQFTGGGEPTVHQAFYEVVALAQSLGMRTGLVTNGVKLDPRESAVQALDWIRVSVDAGTEATYCRVRRVAPSHWVKAWANLRTLAATYKGRLSAGFVVTEENAQDLPEFVRRCAEHGVGMARVGAVFSERGEGYYEGFKSECADFIAIAAQTAKELGVDLVTMFDRRMGDLHAGAPRAAFCGYQYLTAYVGADLGVYRCCNTAYTTRGRVGDLRSISFGAFLKQRKVGDGFDARGCHYCQFNGQNEAIASVIREPDDSAFV